MLARTLLPGLGPDEQRRLAVWRKGQMELGEDPAVYRRDYAGRMMRYEDYGDRSSKFGWEIGHIRPVIFGGGDDLFNLRPENWLTNSSAGGLLGGPR